MDGMATGTSEIGHPHIAAPMLINQRHAGHAVVISRARIPNAIKQTSVDLKYDFQVAGEKRAFLVGTHILGEESLNLRGELVLVAASSNRRRARLIAGQALETMTADASGRACAVSANRAGPLR
jgi:hypothetical protein